MLPATKSHRFSLADVLPSCLDALHSRPGRMGLAPASKAIVLLVDGLGVSALAARSGHARTLAPLLGAGSTIRAAFPTTTASSIATLTTGESAGVHGLVGYTVLDAANDRVVNELSGWDERFDPQTWQRVRTLFEQAADEGIESFVVASESYRDSGFTRAVLRGAEFHSGKGVPGRLHEARRILDRSERCIVYVYVPELDKAGHAHGWQSPQWTHELEALDGAVKEFSGTLRPDEGLIITADHGMLDVPQSRHILFDADPGLVDGIRFVAGEPRCLQLHFEPDATREHRDTVLERWQASESSRSWVTSRDDAISSGWFGPAVDPQVVPRIGDLIVAARKAIAYYDSRATGQTGRSMVGQHGSWTQDETEVPLLKMGAWAA
ncbi:alkaline phosphatase family protein [Parafrigoribacterium humi]|jgi:predicted AlkP superfamily pyrophosphatase or phosphodiesterase|uniref:alkaline phosphatase family protein n=1 Tax=Parafrigoribacterium humi TaxID=3144664 RepID=UPI0032ED40B2